MSIINIENIWKDWHIVEPPIGEGSYGKVYKAVKKTANMYDVSAVKVITIPQSPSDIDSLLAKGYTIDSIQKSYETLAEECRTEIKLMIKLRGNSYIVSVDDWHEIIHSDGIGHDFYIRMEFLKNFNSYLTERNHKLNDEEIAQIGVDLCSALECCAKENIVHRDIKPENIFISAHGIFKLGDFGIARKLDSSPSSLSRKGTYHYMAPEIFHGISNYDAKVDIYSLGLVLYELLNNNRPPFLTSEQSNLTSQDMETAIAKRMSGKYPLPVPGINRNPQLVKIILKACSYDPASRYENASQMKQELLALKENPYDKTVKQTVQFQPTNILYNSHSKRHFFRPRLVIIPIMVLLIVVGLSFYLIPKSHPAEDEKENSSEAQTEIIQDETDLDMLKTSAHEELSATAKSIQPSDEQGFQADSIVYEYTTKINNASSSDEISDLVTQGKEELNMLFSNEKEEFDTTLRDYSNTLNLPTEKSEQVENVLNSYTKKFNQCKTGQELQTTLEAGKAELIALQTEDTVTETPTPSPAPQLVDETIYVADVYESLTLREEASTTSSAIVLLPPGTRMQIIENTNATMVKVHTLDNQLEGYVNKFYITAEGEPLKRQGNSSSSSNSTSIYYADVYEYLTLRNAASTSATPITYLVPYTYLNVISTSNGMAYVEVIETGEKGYVNAEYITKREDGPKRAGKMSPDLFDTYSFYVGATCYLTCNEYVTLRDAPSTSGNEIRKVYKNELVTITELTNSEFYRVTTGTGEWGYVMAKYLALW